MDLTLTNYDICNCKECLLSPSSPGSYQTITTSISPSTSQHSSPTKISSNSNRDRRPNLTTMTCHDDTIEEESDIDFINDDDNYNNAIQLQLLTPPTTPFFDNKQKLHINNNSDDVIISSFFFYYSIQNNLI
jgi:hypothetical protein